MRVRPPVRGTTELLQMGSPGAKIWRYESTDLTTAAQELACLAGVCEVDG